MSAPPFVRFYANDWFSGCAGLKADERGVYISICVYIWNTGRRVPLDDAEASRMMAINFKSYQRIRDRLVVLGKVTKYENGYGNERAERELSSASEAVERNARRTGTPSDRSDGQGKETSPQNGQALTKNAEAGSAVLTDGTIDHGIDHRIDGTTDHGIDRQKEQQNQSPSIEPEPEPNNKKKVIACDPDGVKFENGSITLDASNWSFWLPHFGDDAEALSLALMQASGFIQVNDRSKPLAAKVGSQLAMMARAKRERDSRYKASKETNRATASTSGRPGWVVEKERKSAAAKAAMEEVLAGLSSGVSNVC